MLNIKKKLAVSYLQRNATLVLQLVSSLILARLLSPAEIGIFAIGSVAVSFLHVLRDLGISGYIVQEKELSTERIRTAQGFMWVTSSTLALVVFLAAVPFGHFYNEEGVTDVLRVLAVNTLLLPVGAITIGLMSRRMEFERLFVLNVSSAVVQAGASILLAALGYGFMSLAWGSLAGGLTTALIAAAFRDRDQPWIPSFSERKRVFAGCSRLSGSSILYELGLSGPELICGRSLGFEAVAFYGKAQGAAMLLLRALVDSIVPVAVSYYSHCSRSDISLKEPYLRALSCLSVVALPAFACLAVLAGPVIDLLYGDQWLAATVPLQIATSGAAMIALANVAGAVLVGSGRAGDNFALHAVFQPAKIVLALLAAQAGLIWIVIAVAAADIGISLASILRVNRIFKVSWSECFSAVSPSIGLAVIEGLISWAILSVGREQALGSATILVAAALIIITSWALALFAIKHALVADFIKRRA